MYPLAKHKQNVQILT